jgi:hypothetical protein
MFVQLAPTEAPQRIAATGQRVEPGEVVEIPDHVAGRPPSGEGEDRDLGEGLLAQDEKWLPSNGPKEPTAAEVLAEVGDDPAAAAEAIAVEQTRSRPRKKLLEQLEAITQKDGEV